MIDLQVAISEDREIKFECSEAVTSWITILDLDGNAIKGAEISRLDVTDRHGTRFVLEPPGIKLLYPAIKKSDAQWNGPWLWTIKRVRLLNNSNRLV